MLAKDAMMMIQGKVFAKNLAAILAIQPLMMRESSKENNMKFWLSICDNESAEFIEMHSDMLLKMTETRYIVKGLYKTIKY